MLTFLIIQEESMQTHGMVKHNDNTHYMVSCDVETYIIYNDVQG